MILDVSRSWSLYVFFLTVSFVYSCNQLKKLLKRHGFFIEFKPISYLFFPFCSNYLSFFFVFKPLLDLSVKDPLKETRYSYLSPLYLNIAISSTQILKWNFID